MTRKRTDLDSYFSAISFMRGTAQVNNGSPRPSDRRKTQSLDEFLKSGGKITKLDTPKYTSTHNSRYRQTDKQEHLSYNSSSRFSQAFEDKKEELKKERE